LTTWKLLRYFVCLRVFGVSKGLFVRKHVSGTVGPRDHFSNTENYSSIFPILFYTVPHGIRAWLGLSASSFPSPAPPFPFPVRLCWAAGLLGRHSPCWWRRPCCCPPLPGWAAKPPPLAGLVGVSVSSGLLGRR
jgi:hypothetical protein